MILTKMKETTKSLIDKTISNEIITLFISINQKDKQKRWKYNYIIKYNKNY